MTALAQATYVRPWLYDRQRAAIFDPARITCIEASTKSGKTVGCMVWLLEHALSGMGDGAEYWWAAPVYAQAKIAYRRMKRGLPQWTFKKNDSELTVTLGNGAVMRFLGSDNPDSLYGEDVHAAVIDEASRCKEEAWHAVRSTLTATRGPVRIIGNVKGKKNWAYRLGQKARADEPGYSYHRITAHDAAAAGVLDEQEVVEAKRDLPWRVYQELFEAEATDDGSNPFGTDAQIRAVVTEAFAPGPVKAWGWDLAKKQDWTVGIGLNADGWPVAMERFQMGWPETEERIRSMVKTTPALVDSTGVGDPIVERLQKGRSNFHGYLFTSRSKQQLMERLATMIQHEEVFIPDGVCLEEVLSFEMEYTRTGVRYTAPDGMHDDCVDSLALAAACLVEHGSRGAVEMW